MTKLLLDEYPLVILPKLAVAVGLNNAIFIQQIWYWQKKNEKQGYNLKDGHTWVYNTYEAWQEQFPFWSVRTIQRIALNCEKDGLIVVSKFNKMKIDKTKWYRVNEATITALVAP